VLQQRQVAARGSDLCSATGKLQSIGLQEQHKGKMTVFKNTVKKLHAKKLRKTGSQLGGSPKKKRSTLYEPYLQP
jgi:hypothetical protein